MSQMFDDVLQSHQQLSTKLLFVNLPQSFRLMP